MPVSETVGRATCVPASRTAAEEVVLVHSSDVHVDDEYTARAHDGDGTRGLAAVLRTARSLSADIVLLAGDVFEHNRLPDALVEQAATLLARSGLAVVVLPGNHDPAMDGSVWHRGGIGEVSGVHILGVTHDEHVRFDRHDLDIWGRAHRDYDDMQPLATPPKRRARWHVAMAHGHYEPDPDPNTALRPSWLIGDADIAATQADYLALGHWNRAAPVGPGKVPAYYSGSPELAETVNLIRLSTKNGVTVTRAPILWD